MQKQIYPPKRPNMAHFAPAQETKAREQTKPRRDAPPVDFPPRQLRPPGENPTR